MSHLTPEKLHVTYLGGARPDGPTQPRRYTLTHSDRTGDLFLSIGSEYDRAALRGFQARLMRDEVLAEWGEGDSGPVLHVHCHVSGGWLSFGPPGWRDSIFRHHLPQVLEAFHYGDRALFDAYPALDDASVIVHFHAAQRRYKRTENWGTLKEYTLARAR